MADVGTVALEEVEDWLNLELVTGKYSQTLVYEIAERVIIGSAGVFDIFREIGLLEGKRNRPTGTKAAAPFRRPPLFGLWHKHYSPARFMLKNLANHWTPTRFDIHLQKTLEIGATLDETTVRKIAREIVIDGFQQRMRDRKGTGEWIIYARLDSTNYYLTLGVHGDDEAISRRVRNCLNEFPELATPMGMPEAMNV